MFPYSFLTLISIFVLLQAVIKVNFQLNTNINNDKFFYLANQNKRIEKLCIGINDFNFKF